MNDACFCRPACPFGLSHQNKRPACGSQSCTLRSRTGRLLLAAAQTSACEGRAAPGPPPWRTTQTLPGFCPCADVEVLQAQVMAALGFWEFWCPFSISPCSSAVPHTVGFTNNHLTSYCIQHCKLPSLWWFAPFPFFFFFFFCYTCCIKIRSDMFLQPFHSFLMARNWFSVSVLLPAVNILELWYYSFGLCPCWFFQNRATRLFCPDIINFVCLIVFPGQSGSPYNFAAFIYGFEPLLSPVTPPSWKLAAQVTWSLILVCGTNLYFLLWQSSAQNRLSPTLLSVVSVFWELFFAEVSLTCCHLVC